MDDPTAQSANLTITLDRQQDGSYRGGMRMYLPASASDYIPAHGCAVQLDQAALLALSSNPLAYGQALSQQLFADQQMHDAWVRAQSVAQHIGAPLRLRLELDPDDGELHRIIWETLCDPRDNTPLALSERVLLSRYLGTTDLGVVHLTDRTALRAVVAIANPSNLGRFHLAPVDVTGEMARMQEVLGDLPTTYLATGKPGRATLEHIRATLREGPCILYLTCHGTLVNDQPVLWLEGNDGLADQISGDAFIAAIQELAVRPLLIILASCRSGGDGVKVLSALAPRLVQAGTPAVIGAQGDIAMAQVAAALPVLLRELLRDGRIDRALAAARGPLRNQPDWWRLALWTHLRDGRLWGAPVAAVVQTIVPAKPAELIICEQLQISFVWAETIDAPPHPLTQALAPLNMSGPQRYKSLFTQLRDKAPQTRGAVAITLPWNAAHSAGFWQSYLGQRPPNNVAGKEAYMQLVPIQVALPWRITAVGFRGTAVIEGFCYPFGVTCTIHVRCDDQVESEELIPLAASIRQARIFSLQRGPDAPAETGSLSWIAHEALAELCTLCYGPGVRGRVAPTPFSITTLLRGQGVSPVLPVMSGGAAHRLLEALATWRIPEPDGQLPSLDAARIPSHVRQSQAGDVLYASSRGRVVWLPRHFSKPQPGRALERYHRHLVLAALQVESLGGIIRRAAAQINAGERALGEPLGKWADRSRVLLSQLYNGSEDVTYRTMSSQRQIIDNEILTALNTVRRTYKQDPLPGA